MLDRLALVHLNGRVYDPYLGKFLSADPMVTDPTNGQNYNRYSYVLNNPTNLTDPTGFEAEKNKEVEDGHAESNNETRTERLHIAEGWKTIYQSPDSGSGNGTGGESKQANSTGTNKSNAKDAGPAKGGGFFSGVKLGYGTGSVLELPSGTETGTGYELGHWARGLGMADVPILGDLWQMRKGIADGNANRYFAGSLGLGLNLWLPGEGKLGVEAAESLAAKGVAGETRFINGVKVTDRATGNVLQGTVDLKPTLDRLSAGKSFSHRNDGSVFGNKEGLLPQQPGGYYREYVHPTPGVNGPGPQRIVTGQGGEIFYTPDHYGTFIRVNP